MLAAVIQARMGSTRLPGKTMADIQGKPMLERVVERVRASSFVEQIAIATTREKQDDVIAEWASEKGLTCFRGSEADVLDRLYQTALNLNAKEILRVTPDCPLLDPALIDQAIEVYRAGQYDYVTNTTLGREFPDGLDVEVFSFQALETAWREAKQPSEREHVTTYIRNHPKQFRIGKMEAPESFSHMKWSVDTSEDLDFIRAVYRLLGSSNGRFGFREILLLLKKEPGLSGARSASVVNEGYYRSFVSEPPVPAQKRPLKESESLKARAARLIPGEAQTFSKGPTQFVQGVAPSFLVRGTGSRVWDTDGNEYLDCAMALGSVILGYGDPDVDEAVQRQLRQGVGFSLSHPVELELAELLHELIPCAEMVRFGKNGSDATSGAVRLARAFTGREMIACCGYHGWQDWYIGTTSRNLGVPLSTRQQTVPFEYNNPDSLKKIFERYPGQIAAVILEPVGIVEPQADFLKTVEALTHQAGAVLVFDEVLTGFRFALGGAQEYFGVVPDLACFGKAIANGFPLSALVGRRSIMKLLEEVFFSFTFGGETLSLAAAAATLRKMIRENVVDHLWCQGRKLKDGYNVLARAYGLEGVTSCAGYFPRSVIQFHGKDESGSLALKSLFQQECIKRGVLFTGAQNLSFSHGEAEVNQILRVYRSAMEQVAEAVRAGRVLESLEGEPVRPVIRQP